MNSKEIQNQQKNVPCHGGIFGEGSASLIAVNGMQMQICHAS
jgi:hypothetical protein